MTFDLSIAGETIIGFIVLRYVKCKLPYPECELESLCPFPMSITIIPQALLRIISLMSRVFTNGPWDRGSIPGRVIPKNQKIVLNEALLNTQNYKVRIKGKVKQSRERNSAPLHVGVIAIEKGAFGSLSTKVTNFFFYLFLSNTDNF